MRTVMALTGAAVGVSLAFPMTALATPTQTSAPAKPARGTTGPVPSRGAGCAATTTQVNADDLETALAHTQPGEVVCVPMHPTHHTISTERAHPHGRHAKRARHSREQRPERPRAMTSGERQYRNGCQRGYTLDQCEQFSVTSLLAEGINPYQ